MTVQTPDTRAGRIIGLLLLVHLVTGLILPYVLLSSSMMAPDAVLEAFAEGAAAVRAAAMLFIVAAALVLAIAIAAWPVLRARGGRLAIAFMALAVANLPLQLFEAGSVLTILSLSGRLAASPDDAAMLHAVGAAAAYARRGAHFTQLFVVVSWLFLFYLTLWRTEAVPRVLAGLGMITTLMQIAGVPLRAFLGLGLITQMAMPLAPVHVALAAWLIVKGLRSGAVSEPRLA